MKRKGSSMPKKTQARRPVKIRVPVIASKPVVVIVDDREVQAIPIPRSAMGKLYDFLAGLVK